MDARNFKEEPLNSINFHEIACHQHNTSYSDNGELSYNLPGTVGLGDNKPNPNWRWNCCACDGGGGQSYVYDYRCNNCGHQRASCCETYTIK
ncbi:hypothetical protein M426DRAFT_8709 [Hypoxylon sp. CI-4A]|nr:hypothetical protein M426DRAFT_8709 [Hypoxylon sp. CI-4A]